MASFTELDMVVSCLHPKIINVAKSHLVYLKDRYISKELLLKLLSLVDVFYDNIMDNNGECISSTQFDAEVLKLNLGDSTNQIVSASYNKCISYTDAELLTIKNTLGELITNEVISATKRNNIDSPIAFVKALQEFNVDNVHEIDKKLYRESSFTDIDISVLEESIKGSVLKSSIDMINKCSPLGGYLDRTLTMVSGKPGCFTGDTMVMLSDGSCRSMAELNDSGAKDIEVYCMDEFNNLRISVAESCEITKYVDQLCYIKLDIGTVLKCTPDHKILLADGKWVQACQLKYNDSLMVMHRLANGYNLSQVFKVVDVDYVQYGKSIPVYDLINVDKYHNFSICAHMGSSDYAIFVHNSGKSLFLIQEAWNFVLQGKKVLYLALGDMNEFHFITRITAQMLKMSLSMVNINFAYLYRSLTKQYPILNNLQIQYFLPDSVTCGEWLSFIKSIGYYDEYDVFIIDYDTNFASDEDMYKKGETTYNALKALSDRTGKYVFVACQPKPNYFSEEILPLESGSESSRKVQIVDNMITISCPPSPGNINHIGIINVAKYRGGAPASVPYLMDKNGRFEPISLPLYNYLKVTRDSVTLPGSGCESTCQVISPDSLPEVNN